MRQRNMENGPLAHVCLPSTSVINSGAVSPPLDHNQHCALCDGLHGQMTDAGLAGLLHIANVAQPLSLELSGSFVLVVDVLDVTGDRDEVEPEQGGEYSALIFYGFRPNLPGIITPRSRQAAGEFKAPAGRSRRASQSPPTFTWKFQNIP